LRSAFSDPANVVESASLYDSILLCSRYYGAEQTVRGWFTTFATFAAARDHRFFKVRTEGVANLAYTNLESADTMNFPFMAYSMGISFFAPASNMMSQSGIVQGVVQPVAVDPLPSHLWQFELPRHSAIVFKTNQDVRAEVPCFACPPGYGPTGGGAALEMNTQDAQLRGWKQRSALNSFGSQGVPVITNRYKFPVPLVIPKNATIEGELVLSEYARYLIGGLNGPYDYVFQNGEAVSPLADFFPMRFGIVLSLFGLRLVQQRGQYHV